MPYCVLDGNQYFYYENIPEKPAEVNKTIIFIHGAGGRGKYWLKQLADIGSKVRALALDLPGHGKSGGSACSSIAAYREFVRKFIDKVVRGRFYLAGHSMGGAITLDFSLNYPELLEGIILIATGARLKVLPAALEVFRSGRHYLDLARIVYGKKAAEQMIELGTKEIAATSPVVWFKDLTACDRFDVTSRLAEIEIPALILAGTDDLLTPLKYSRLLEAGLPNARLRVIEDAGHMLMLEQPGDVNRHIIDFMSLK